MTLKDFIEEMLKRSKPPTLLSTGQKLMELESIARYFNIIYGVELDINIRPIETEEGRFYGKGLIDALKIK